MSNVRTLPDLLRTVADAWVEAGTAEKASLARLGRTVVNDTSFFSRLETPGASTTTATLERFARFLLDPANWPDGRVVQEAREFAHRLGVSLSVAGLATGQSADLSGEREHSDAPSGAGREASASLGFPRTSSGGRSALRACGPDQGLSTAEQGDCQ